jgi:hypothetical protein
MFKEIMPVLRVADLQVRLIGTRGSGFRFAGVRRTMAARTVCSEKETRT